MSVQVCQAPIVFPTVHQATTYSEVADALASLESLVDFVYSGITAKITQEKSRLASLSTRIEVAQIKTQKLVGSNAATTVYSAAKYPSSPAWQDPLTIFGTVKEPLAPLHTVVAKPTGPAVAPGPAKEMLVDAQEISLFKEIVAKEEKPVPSGLGTPKINHVPSLLLFNSQENVYKRYLPGDNLAGTPTKIQKKFGMARSLALAPGSVASGESMDVAPRQVVGWQPGPVDLPEHLFPENLSLPNLTDERFSGKVLPINPSDAIGRAPARNETLTSITPGTRGGATVETKDTTTVNVIVNYSSLPDFNAPQDGVRTHKSEPAIEREPVRVQEEHAEYAVIIPDPATIPPPLDPNLHTPSPSRTAIAHNTTTATPILADPPKPITEQRTTPMHTPTLVDPPKPTTEQRATPMHSETPAHEPKEVKPAPTRSMGERSKSFIEELAEGQSKLRPTQTAVSRGAETPQWVNRIIDIRKSMAGDDSASESEWED